MQKSNVAVHDGGIKAAAVAVCDTNDGEGESFHPHDSLSVHEVL